MSHHAHLSVLNPEYAVLLPQIPPSKPMDIDNVKILREALKPVHDPYKRFLEPYQPPESAYSVSMRRIPVDGGEIIARCVVPEGKIEGETFPVLVWFHGGGWVLGDVDMDDIRLRILAVKHRISVVNVDYRLLPEHPYPTSWEDCYAATKWIIGNASLLSASLDKGFIVGGQSAGGNLAASTVHRARDNPFFALTPPTGQFLQWPGLLHYAAPVLEEWKSRLQSYEQNKDTRILSSEAIIQFTDIVGPPPKVDVYPGVPHAFDSMFPQLEISNKAYNDLDEGIAWLLAQTRA